MTGETGERRKNPRVAMGAPVRVNVDGRPVAGRLRDICRDAALVDAPHRCPLGTAVLLTLDLPGGTPLLVAGTVIRLVEGPGEDQGLAILFGDLTPTTAAKLDAFVAEYS